jgi:ketosteroid isomerase-like protein
MESNRIDEVLTANSGFYECICDGDLDKMKSIWLKEPKSKCVHPGWPMLYGWEAINESWKNIFEAGGPAHIEISDVRGYVSGDTAWVICIEKISQRVGDQIRLGYAQSTNVFEYSASSWKLVIHHASPIPVPRGETTSNHNLQ